MRRERLKINLLYHDLKGPLAVVETGIATLLDRAERYGALSEKQERVLHRTLRNIKVAHALVNDLLELGRAKNGVMHLKTVKLSDVILEVLWQTFDLASLHLAKTIKRQGDLDRVLHVLPDEGISLKVQPALWERELLLDEKKIVQVLRNLLSNALKHRKKSIDFIIDEQEGGLVFSVRDDGRGIPAQYHKKIFETYFQLSDTEQGNMRGYGLGLAGALMLVEEMGGELLLESDTGMGATFIFRLPLLAGER